MYKNILLIILSCFILNGCFCKPTSRLDINSGSSKVSIEDRKELIELSNIYSEAIKEEKADELFTDENISELMQSIPGIKNTYGNLFPCMKGYIGELESYNPDKKTFSSNTINTTQGEIEVFSVMQPMKYSKANNILKLEFVKEEGEFKLLGIYWQAPMKSGQYPDYFTCYTQKKSI